MYLFKCDAILCRNLLKELCFTLGVNDITG